MDATLAYDLALFLHIAGVLALFASLTLEGVALRGLRLSRTGEDAGTWLGLMRPLRTFGIGSLMLILLPGFYLAATIDTRGGWIAAGLLGFAAILALGAAVTGRRMARVGPALGRARGPLDADALLLARDGQLAISHATRVALGLGIVWLMTVKPDFLPSILVLLVAGAAGLVAGRLMGRASRDRRTWPDDSGRGVIVP